MQDIPMFTTEYGLASLALREIPYNQTAYIRIHVTSEPEALLKECVDFCIAVGAEVIYGQGHECMESRPLYETILVMERSAYGLPETDACLVPVSKAEQEDWRSIYNKRMKGVSNAAYVTSADMRDYVNKGMAYFVYQNDEIIGIGIASDDYVHTLASVMPGTGRAVLLALCKALRSKTVTLDVASTNTRAIRLYRELGFTIAGEKMRWYKIL